MYSNLKEYLLHNVYIYNKLLTITGVFIHANIVFIKLSDRKNNWACSSFKGNPEELKEFLKELIS